MAVNSPIIWRKPQSIPSSGGKIVSNQNALAKNEKPTARQKDTKTGKAKLQGLVIAGNRDAKTVRVSPGAVKRVFSINALNSSRNIQRIAFYHFGRSEGFPFAERLMRGWEGRTGDEATSARVWL